MSKSYSEKQIKSLIEAFNHVNNARLALLDDDDFSIDYEEIENLVELSDELASKLHEAIPATKFTDLNDNQINESLSNYYESCIEIDEAKTVRQLMRRYDIGQLTESDIEIIEWAFKELLIEKTLYPERFK